MNIDGTLLGERLREKRRAAGVTQKELAERVGISAPAINRFEKGEKTPSTDTLLKLAKHLGVTTDYLLGASTDENIFLDSDVVEAFQTFKALSTQDRKNILANIHFLKDLSQKKG